MITVFADDNESSRRMMKMVMNSIDPMGSHYFAENAAKAIDLWQSIIPMCSSLILKCRG